MSQSATAALTGVLLFAAAVWIGGFVAIGLVARAASDTLDPPARVALFRSLGRSYGAVATVALVVAYATGAALLTQRTWNATCTATVVLAVALVLTTALGVAQARQMTRLRHHALDHPSDPALADLIRRRSTAAAALRGLIGLLSLALLALGVLVGT